MRSISSICFCLFFGSSAAIATELDKAAFAQTYFDAWASTQKPDASKQDLAGYLELLTDDVGHQHLPYDPDATRDADGKQSMRAGMLYYLGGHDEYSATLQSVTVGHDVVIIKYHSKAKGLHPQTKQVFVQDDSTVEVLEIENGKVAVVRKYSE
jgi:ketosteroid isomerase-like protein